MEDASLRYGPAMDSSASASLSRPFERHLRAKNLSGGTVASYLVGVRQFTAFLQPHGPRLIHGDQRGGCRPPQFGVIGRARTTARRPRTARPRLMAR
jgi:hypothetical protein